jgi:hypothetical protein
MFRSKFILTAMVAVAAVLSVPAVSEAAFTVTVTIDGVSVFSQSLPDNSANSAGITTIQGSFDNSGVSGSFTVNTNVPGGNTGMVLDSTGVITSVSGSHEVVITATAQPFTSPGNPGDKLSLIDGISSLNATFGGVVMDLNNSTTLNLGSQDIYGLVDPDNNAGTSNSVRTSGPFTKQGPSGDWTAVTQFTRGSAYSLSSVIDLQLITGDSGSITTQATVFAPAPAGLAMLAGALPFAGLLRLRRRKSEAVTAA